MVAANNRVLVVDDEQIVRESYQRVLTDAGYKVRAVGSGRAALEACRSEPFDVMLADLKMPDMDGLEVSRVVSKEFPEVRVIIITGYPTRASAEEAAKLGICEYLEKPLSPDRLNEATASALARLPRRAAPASPEAPPWAAGAPGAAAEADPPAPFTKLNSEGAASTSAAVNAATKLVVFLAMGFLVGVVVAYAIAPSHALAWLALGAAITSGALLGLFSDALRAVSRSTTP